MNNETKELIRLLKLDIERHKRKEYKNIGNEYHWFVNNFQGSPGIAFTFWDSWVDEKEHGFPNFYENIKFEDWPVLAQTVVDDLEAGLPDASNQIIYKTFVRSVMEPKKKGKLIRFIEKFFRKRKVN